MSAPIWDAVQAYLAESPVRMHMPAHKGNASALPPEFAQLAPLDVTELPETGSLFDGEGCTARAEQAAAALFGTAATFLSAGGSTLCIQAMLRLACPQGGKLLCSRVIHRSAANAMALLDIEPVWLLPDSSAGSEFSGRITPQVLEQALRRHPDAKALYLTSPDYFGVISDISALSRVTTAHGILLLVDAAHGAHLHALEPDCSAVALGADMAAESAHKTLPVLTGGAWLQLGSRADVAGARQAMALFGSTSPSYPILLTLDLCRDWLETGGKAAIRAACDRVRQTKALLTRLDFALPQGTCDPMRLAFFAQGVSTAEIRRVFRQHGISAEYCAQQRVILIPSAQNSEADFTRTQQALQALANLPKTAPREDADALLQALAKAHPLAQIAITPREALLAPTERIAASESLGRIAATPVCPCPPAIPLVMPGETISREAVAQFSAYRIRDLEVVK